MKILLIRFSALGDVAMMAPVVRGYAEGHPDDELWVLSKPFHAPLFDFYAKNVYFLGRDPKRDYRGIGGLYRLFRELHAMRFDLVVDLHDVLRTKVLRGFFRLHGYKVRCIDKHRSLRRLITVPEGKKLLQRLPTAFENYREGLYGSEGGSEGGSDNVATHEGSGNSSLPGAVRIGIAPFAAHEGKIYPLERMERVIEMLVEQEPGGRIILFGGGGKEREVMEKWAGRFANVVLATDEVERLRGEGFIPADKQGLAAELEVMRGLDVMVSMDSANQHLASLVGTRVVSIWGATHPWAGFLGWGQREEDCVQRQDLGCRPCSIYGNRPCMRGDMECMNIKPEDVVRKIKS